MSLLERILQNKDEPPCNDCKHLIFPKKNLPFCKIKDRIILPDYPPTKCELWGKTGMKPDGVTNDSIQKQLADALFKAILLIYDISISKVAVPYDTIRRWENLIKYAEKERG